jgi:hypothetical protein
MAARYGEARDGRVELGNVLDEEAYRAGKPIGPVAVGHRPVKSVND